MTLNKKPENFSLFINDITEYLFAGTQDSEIKRMFITMTISVALSLKSNKQDKAIRDLFGVDSWSEGLLNTVCSHPLLREHFRELVKELSDEKSSQVKTSIDKQ